MSEALLVRYSLILQQDGKFRTQVDCIDPDEFLRVTAEEGEWPEAGVVAAGIRYLLKQLEAIDIELDKHLDTL